MKRAFFTKQTGLVSLATLAVLMVTVLAASGVSADEPVKYTLNFHRGGGNAKPENTLETFLWAWNLGVIPEGDVQYTKDGVAVMSHDSKLKRIPWNLPEEMKNKPISDYDWSVIQTLDVGSYKGPEYANQRIPRMEAVFAAMSGCPDRCLYLDEKGLTEENQKEIAKLVHQYGIVNQMFFTAGNYGQIKRWHEICPDGKAMLWLGYCWTKDGKCNMDGLNKALDELRAANFAGVDHLVVHILAHMENDEPFSPSSEYLQKLNEEMKQRGVVFSVITWTEGDNPEVYRRLIKLGLTGFATDYPEVLLEAVK